MTTVYTTTLAAIATGGLHRVDGADALPRARDVAPDLATVAVGAAIGAAAARPLSPVAMAPPSTGGWSNQRRISRTGAKGDRAPACRRPATSARPPAKSAAAGAAFREGPSTAIVLRGPPLRPMSVTKT
ncbi:MAG: hypothetical protein ACLFU0_05970 [Alphaproteobacteria bacterium]